MLDESLEVFGHKRRLLMNDPVSAVWDTDQPAVRRAALKPIEAVGKRETFLFADDQERWGQHLLPGYQ